MSASRWERAGRIALSRIKPLSTDGLRTENRNELRFAFRSGWADPVAELEEMAPGRAIVVRS